MEFLHNNMTFQVGINVEQNLIVSTRTDNLSIIENFDPAMNIHTKSVKYPEIFSVSIMLSDLYKGAMEESAVYEAVFGKLWNTVQATLKLEIDKKLQGNE